MTTPSAELGKIILVRLKQEKLLSDDQAKKMEIKLASGKLRPEDWRLGIEICMDEEKLK